MAVPFAKQDLVDSLDAWHGLLEMINSKLPEPETQPLSGQGLFSQDTLRAAGISEDSFAGNFLASARKSWFGLLGPGLKLATSDDLINNPWKIANNQVESQHRHTNIPIPLLVGSVSIDGWYRGRSSAPKILWGLYLEGLSREDPFPMDDSCRLALPYSLGDNGLALRADGHKLGSFYLPGRFELYQIGQHPYMPCRGTQLYMVLDAFARHVADGLWEVGADGVNEPSTVFQDADTEERRDEYRLYI